MNERKKGGNEGLFIAALAACFVGIGLLLRTTGVEPSLLRLWPITIMLVGAILLFFSWRSGERHIVLFAGSLFFIGFGLIALFSAFLHLRPSRSWPLFMVLVGVDWLATGKRISGRFKPTFVAPSLSFILLGGVFCLFSFGFVAMSFRHFMAIWWPSILIAGGIVLFALYGLGRYKGDHDEGSDSE